MDTHADERKLLLIGLDGADWQLIRPLMERGELPVLSQMVSVGCSGNLRTLQPTLSPMLWNTIATGKRSYQHGIHGFTEIDPITEGIRPVSSTSRKCKAVWNILQQSGKRCHLLNWFASHPAEPLSGVVVSDLFSAPGPMRLGETWPVPKHAVHPEALRDTLAELRVYPDEIDEQVISLFVKDWPRAYQAKDKRLIALVRELAQAYTLQNLTLWILENQAWDFATVYFRFTDILCHHFMPYCAPKLDAVSEEDFALYNDVVPSAYRLFDLLLGNLCHQAGPEATIMIVSDHGFRSGDRRAAQMEDPFANAEAHHREQGVFCVAGPGLKRNETVHSTSLCDITPTILQLYGLPAGGDMDGRVLGEIFQASPDEQRVASWEQVDGESGQLSDHVRMDQGDAESLLRQFEALGYIDPISADKDEAIGQTLRSNRWNLAREFLDAGHYKEALPLLQELHRQVPANSEITFKLSQTYRVLGMTEEAELTVQEVIDTAMEGPGLLLLLGNLALDRKDTQKALGYLKEADAKTPKDTTVLLGLSRAYASAGEWQQARQTFERILEIDPEFAFAYQGLANVALRERDYETAMKHALLAIELAPNLALAHYYLGLALDRMGLRQDAILALDTCLIYAPWYSAAHRALLRIHQQEDPHSERAAKHKAFLDAAPERYARQEAERQQLRESLLSADTDASSIIWENDDDAALPDEVAEFEVFAAKDTPVIVVSGLPRSGTSLMMQLLRAAGVPVKTDEQRTADESNPGGYLEWEAVKQLRQQPGLITQARGQAIKVVSLLIGHLPKDNHYKVLFMDRAIAEVAASQEIMMRQAGRTDRAPAGEKTLEQHREGVIKKLETRADTGLMHVPYTALVEDPKPLLEKIFRFIDHPPPQDWESLLAVIHPEWRHHHSETVTE